MNVHEVVLDTPQFDEVKYFKNYWVFDADHSVKTGDLIVIYLGSRYHPGPGRQTELVKEGQNQWRVNKVTFVEKVGDYKIASFRKVLDERG